MTADQQLPNIQVGRDVDEGDDRPESTSTVEYLNYEVLTERGWSLDDDALFAKAAAADLDERDHGTIEVPEHTYVLDAAENQGHEWPFECRAASCANCAAILVEGDLEMDMDLILTDEEVQEKNIRLACQSTVESDEAKIGYNAKYLDYLQDRVIGVREV
jgi:ferredoxin